MKMAEGGEETDIAKALLSGSDAGCDLPCQPCGVEGTMVESSGFCVTCDEYLCDDCYRHHKKSKLSRQHVVLDKDAMPRDPSKTKTVDVCTEPCKQHDGNIIQCYCPHHKEFGCTVCMTIQHQTCIGIQYIPDVVKDINLDQNEEWAALQGTIDGVRMKIQEVKQSSQKKFEKSNECSSNVLIDFQKLRQKLYDHFQSVEVKLREEVDSITNEDSYSLMQISKECDSALDKLDVVVEEYTGLLTLRQRCKIFTLMKTADMELKTLGEEFDERARNIPIPKYNFVPKRALLELMTEKESVGVISRKYSYNKATKIKDLSAKCSNDSKTCVVKGLTMLSADLLVVTDRANRQLKVIDVVQNKVESVFEFSSDPWDVVKLPDDKFAVTVYDPSQGEIVILKVKSEADWELDSIIKVNGRCRGIAYANDTLIVTFSSSGCGRVDIISMNGDVLKSFQQDKHGQQVFQFPLYVCCNNHQNTIYVTNCGDKGTPNSVTSLSLDGTVNEVYSHSALKGPGKVVMDTYGSLHVCCVRSNNLHTLAGDLSKGSVLLRADDGLEEPYVVCINEKLDEMYVGMKENENIPVYKLF